MAFVPWNSTPSDERKTAIVFRSEQRNVTLTADAYVHGVHIKGNRQMSDNYFDLVPGQVKKVTVKGAGDESLEWHTVR